MYVCLKRYVNKTAVAEIPPYQAFHLTVTIKKMTDQSENQLCDHNNGLFLIILAVPVYSAYKCEFQSRSKNKLDIN